MEGAGSGEPSAGQAVWTPRLGQEGSGAAGLSGASLAIALLKESCLQSLRPRGWVCLQSHTAVSYCHAGLATEFGMEIVVVVCFTNPATKSLELEGPMKSCTLNVWRWLRN